MNQISENILKKFSKKNSTNRTIPVETHFRTRGLAKVKGMLTVEKVGTTLFFYRKYIMK